MATLTVNGRKVTVDDSFRSLSPADQERTVNEIAASMGTAPATQMQVGSSPSTATPAGASQRPAPNADGTYGKAPAGTSLDPISGQMRSREQRAEANPVSTSEGMMRAAQHGVGFGVSDEFNAGLGAAEDVVTGRAILEKFREDRPWLALGSELAGALVLPGGALKGGSLVAQTARGAAVGGATGAAYGFGAGEGGAEARARNAAATSGIGAMAGAAIPVAVSGVRNAVNGRATNRAIDATAEAAPTADDLRAQSSALFRRAEQRGVVVKPDAFAPLVDDITQTAQRLGVDRDVTPAAAAAMRRFAQAGKSKTGIGLQEIDILRRVASNASTSNNPQDRMIAGAMVEKVDDYVLKLMDSDLDAGSAQGLSEELTEARSLWKAMRNSEKLGTAIEAAKDQASGFENGIRIQFRQLLRNKNALRSFSEPKREAIRQVVRGTTTGNWLKRLSRMSFGSGAQTNFLGASVGSGLAASAGMSIGGPVGAAVGAVAAPLIGRAAGQGAERSTLRLANRAQNFAAAGGVPQLPPPADLMIFENALARIAQSTPAGFNALRSPSPNIVR